MKFKVFRLAGKLSNALIWCLFKAKKKKTKNIITIVERKALKDLHSLQGMGGKMHYLQTKRVVTRAFELV